VTGVVAGLSAGPTNPMRLTVGLAAILVGFGSWWTYFDFVAQREPAETPRASIAWMLLHLPLTAAIAAMGATMLRLVDDSGAARVTSATGVVLGGGALVLLATMVGLLATLRAWAEQARLVRPIALACAGSGVFALLIGTLRPSPLSFVGLLVVVFIAPWTFAVFHRASYLAASPDVS
jgi:low temperature requirement protein LtrA